MFTGIVEELGSVVSIHDQTDAVRLTIAGPLVTSDASLGDSIAVSGCCLTVAELDGETFTADVMAETLSKTTLGEFAAGTPVNLERAVTMATRLGGHLVQGHVDGVGEILRRTPGDHWEVVEISLAEGLGRYVVAKGSITVDGVSLTVVHAGTDRFSVSLIPETLARTTLGTKRPGEPVNLEVDVIAKHVERLLTWADSDNDSDNDEEE